MKSYEMKSTKLKSASAVGCLLVAAFFIFYVNTQILMYMDDYFYGIFFRDGLAGFFERTVWHYSNFNGRVFVHVLAQITLAFGTTLFPFVNLTFLLLIGFFAHQTQNDERNIGQTRLGIIICTTFLLATLMLLDVSILRESYLWISASFNYTLGVLMVVVLIFSYKRYMDTSVLRWYMVVLAFLAGATTEQMGLTALFAIALTTVIFQKQENLELKKSVPFVLPCFVGYMTIFMSRATFNRLGSENVSISRSIFELDFGSVYNIVLERFNAISQVMAQSNFGIVFVIFGLLLGATTYFDNSLPKKLRVGFIYSAIILMLKLLPFVWSAGISAVITICFLIMSATVMLRNRKYVFKGIILITAIFSLAIMLLTGTQESRTFFPFILLLMTVCAGLFVKCNLKQTLVLTIYLAICCVVFMPIIMGYRDNRLIMDDNIENINIASDLGGNVFFNIDFNGSYGFTLPHEEAFTYQNFRAFHRIAWYRTVYFYSNINPPIYTSDGNRLVMPVKQQNDNLYMPLLLVATSLGGTYTWTGGSVILFFDDTEYIIGTHTHLVSFYRGGRHYEINLADRIIRARDVYWNVDDIAYILGVLYEYRDGRYIVRLP